jgi:hypothetical protein
MADAAAKVDQKVFESLIAEIKKAFSKLDKALLQHRMLQQLKTDVLKTTKDLLIEERNRFKEENKQL